MRRTWLILIAVLCVLGAVVFLEIRRRTSTPAIPHIASDRLDAAGAGVIEKGIEEVRAAPRSGGAWGRLGMILRSFDYHAEALACFVEAERLEPREPRWPYFQALLLEEDSAKKAEPKLRRAVALCGNQPDAPRLRLAALLTESGRWDDAAEVLRPLIDVEPNHGPALLGLAQIAQVRGHLAEAIDLATRSADDARTQRGAWSLLAAVRQRQGDLDNARAANARAVALPPDPQLPDPFEAEAAALRDAPRELSDRAQQLLAARRLAEAAPIIDRLVREHPQFAEGRLLLGRLQLLQKNPAAAESSIRRHLQLEPQSAAGVFQLGLSLLAQERFDDAAFAFVEATALKHDFAPAHFNLGLARLRAGHTMDAVAPLETALQISPDYVDGYFLLADLNLRLGRKAEAARRVRQVEALAPNDRRLPSLKEQIASSQEKP